MKALFTLLISSMSLGAAAHSLPDYNYELTDIAQKNLTKEKLFSEMDRDFIKVGQSICSNRAHMWGYDFKRQHDLDTGKIFLFYTKKTGEVGRKTWWYHVAPVLNENNNLFVMDAGFSAIKKPLSTQDWLHSFVGSHNCKEIKAGENELIERMFSGSVFPETTSYGTYDCYYKITPAGYWTPASVASNLLGRDYAGNPTRYVRDEIDTDEVYAACTEAVTSPIGRMFGAGKKKCRKYLEN